MATSNATRAGSRRSALIASLAIIVIAMAYLNWQVFTETIDSSPIAVPANSGTADQSSNDALLAPPVTRPKSDFAQTLSRPLFSTNRRPVEHKPKPIDPRVQTARASTADKFQLIGVYLDQGDKGRALIRSGPNAIGTWMSIGEDIEGWRLREVKNDLAVIESGGQRKELRLYPEAD
jgi:hypothetical protein